MKLLNKMRNTGIALLGGLAILSFSAVATGCSDNDENGLYAADGANIDLSIEALGFHNGLLDIGSAQSETVFTVTSTTRWTVEVTNCDGSWCQIVYGQGNSDGAGHIGDGTFIVDAAPNRTGNTRECLVTVYAIESDGSHIPGKSVEINVTQDRQSIQVDYAGGEIPYYGTTNGGYPTVTVKANQSWQASTSHSWVKIIPGPDMEGDKYNAPEVSSEERSVSFQISVEANPGTSVRYAEVSISSPSSAFTPIRLNITQAASTETFFITPAEVPQASWSGETIDFSVYSPRDAWTVQAISAGDWLKLDRTSGEASSEPVAIRATIAANNTTVARQASLVFTRAGGMGTSVIYITQNASAEAPNPDYEPKVSQAWIGSGWTATYASVFAYYSAPGSPVEAGGFVVRDLDSGSQDNVGAHLTADGLVAAELTGLKPETRYEVWAFVVDESGLQVEGTPVSFTTPGLDGNPGSGLPGEDDNTPPSPN